MLKWELRYKPFLVPTVHGYYISCEVCSGSMSQVSMYFISKQCLFLGNFSHLLSCRGLYNAGRSIARAKFADTLIDGRGNRVGERKQAVFLSVMASVDMI
jgi:hypothetical protein